MKDEVIERLIYHLGDKAYPKQEEIPFYEKQTRIVLEHCGQMDAEDILEYLAKGGYSAFTKALFSMTGEEVCQMIMDSGLRGRGGGGYPAGKKWDQVRRQKEKTRYAVSYTHLQSSRRQD